MSITPSTHRLRDRSPSMETGSSQGPPPGYYRDPDGKPAERWWDGQAWTDTTRPLVVPEQESPSPVAQSRWDWRRIANFSSRARRSEYWAAWALAVGAVLVGALLDGATFGDVALFSLLALGVWIWLFWGASINRFHDMGRSGWFFLLFLIPLVNVGVFLWLGIGEGDEGPNKWGPPIA